MKQATIHHGGEHCGVRLWVSVGPFPTSGHVINSAHLLNNSPSKTILKIKKSLCLKLFSHKTNHCCGVACKIIIKKRKEKTTNVFPWPTRIVLRSVKVNTAGERVIALRLELLVTAISV